VTVIADTGWIVAFLDGRDRYHPWAKEQANQYPPPYFTCESVLSEAHFLLQRIRGATSVMRGMIEDGAMDVSFSYSRHVHRVHELLRKYEDRPMDFADACVVRMAEIHSDSLVLTVDALDFRVYRIRRNRSVHFVAPV
jgi:uncharacterized protein